MTSRNIQVQNRIVNALIIETPDLSSHIRLQNTICFLLDCINNALNENKLLLIDNHFNSCINHIKSVCKNNTFLISKDISKIAEELIVEVQQFMNLISTFQKSRVEDIHLEVLLTAKATQIQWLSVCLLEDLKTLFLKHNQIKAYT
jgi:hypothetical protein